MINPMDGESLHVRVPTLVPFCATTGTGMANAAATMVATTDQDLIVMCSTPLQIDPHRTRSKPQSLCIRP
jgi:hypothetical protein